MRRAAPQDVKLADVFVRYYQEHARHAASAVSIRRHLELTVQNLDGDLYVSDFRRQAQQRIVRQLLELEYAQGAVKRIMTSAKAAILWAFNNEIITARPAFLKIAEGTPPERVASIGEIARFWDAAIQPHLQAFTMVLLCTVCRPIAALELTRFQCDLRRGVVDLNPPGRSQTKKRRPVVPLVSALRPWIETAEGPIVSFNGKPIRKVAKVWRTARRAAGLPEDFVPYSIRHTMVSELRARGVPELEIAGIMGHFIFRTTGRYAKYAPDYLGQAKA
jgi:integrase